MNEHDLNESAMKAALEDLLDAIPKSAHPKIMQAIKAKQPKQIADILKVNRVKSRFSEKEAAEMVMDYFMDYFGPLESVKEAVDYKVNDPRLIAAALKALPSGIANRGEKSVKMAKVMWEMWSNSDGKIKLQELARLARVKLGFNEEAKDMEGEEIQEKVDLDARTGPFKRTVDRLSHQRSMWESKLKSKKWDGLYNDGTGKGASIPEPVEFKKESRHFEKEVDGRIRAFKEAMKRVETYRKLRETKKKMITGQKSMKEEVIIESVDEFLDDMEKAYKKGGLKAIVSTGGSSLRDEMTFMDFVENLSRYMKGVPPATMKYIKKEIAGMVKPADLSKIIKYVKESVDVAEAVDMVTKAGVEMIGDAYAIAEEDLSPAQKKYRAFFQKALKKFGADSPADLDTAKKKEFFNYVKTNYKESADILPPHGKTLDEEELSQKQKEYRAFFDKALKKFGVGSPAKMVDAQKKKFFNYLKTNWKG